MAQGAVCDSLFTLVSRAARSKEDVMAQHVEVILEDDVDGSPADETMRFAYNGTQYEIDLSSQNAQALRSTLGKYIEHARRASAPPRQARATRNRVDTTAVRAWAKAQSMEIKRARAYPGLGDEGV